jgi:hypothetical protein
LSGDDPDHEHPLITFLQRYARAFHQDPVTVADRPESDLQLMGLFYESAAADMSEGE